MNELMISLPAEAVRIQKEIEAIPIIEVINEKTNIAANENLKIVNQFIKEFDAICEPERVRLITPLNVFYSLRKKASDMIDAWIKNQKLTIGKYGQEIIRKENEMRRIEQERINAEIKAEIDRLNEQKRIEAERVGKEAIIEEFVPEEIKQEEFIPVQEPVMQNEAKVKSVFVHGSVKEKAVGTITDLPLFLSTLIESNESAWVNLICDKVNQSKLNDFLKSHGIDGRKNNYPGVFTEMVPDVRSR